MVDLLRPGRSRRGRAAVLVAGIAALAAGCAGGASGGGDAAGGARSGAPEGDAARRAASDRWVERGRAALEQGALEKAASRLERAVRTDPSNGRAYLALAEVRIAQGRPGDARGLLERALGLLGPGTPAAARADSLRSSLRGPPD